MAWTTICGGPMVILVNKDLTAGQRAFVALFYGTLPAVCAGFYAGAFASGFGPLRDPDSICILIRALICAAIPVFLAFIAPRVWPILTFAYVFSFYYGYTFSDLFGTLAAALIDLPLAPLAALFGLHLGRPPEPRHPELLWIFAFTLWLAAFVSFLNRVHRRQSARAPRP